MKQMSFRRRVIAAVLILVPLVGSASEVKKEAAERAALEWLILIDTMQYQESWTEAASLFQTHLAPADWERAVEAARRPFGELVSRDLVSATFATELPGAPTGEYVVLQFRTDFENKAGAVETVTPMLDDGQWRVSGYFIR